MSVEFKSPVTSANVNQAFLDKNKDTETLFKLALKRAGSGADVLDVQQAINDLIGLIDLHIADYSAHREFDTKANLDTWATTANNGDFAFATDEKKSYQVIDGVLAEIGGGGGGLNQWESAANYVIGDVVWLLADYKIYVCTADNSDATFTPANWQELSSNFLEGYISVTPNDNISITDSLGTNLFRKDFNELYIEDFKENLPSAVLTASNIAITVNDATNASYLSNTISTFTQSGASTTQYVETAPIAITNSNKWLLEPIKIQAMQGISGGAGTWDFRVFTSTDGVSYTDKNIIVQVGALKNDKIITQLADDTTHVKLRWTIVNPDDATTLTLGGFIITSDAFPVGQMITSGSFSASGLNNGASWTNVKENTIAGFLHEDLTLSPWGMVADKDIDLDISFSGYKPHSGGNGFAYIYVTRNGVESVESSTSVQASHYSTHDLIHVSFSGKLKKGDKFRVVVSPVTYNQGHINLKATAYADNVIVDAATSGLNTQSYTPALQGFGTPTGVKGLYYKAGNRLGVYFEFTTGTRTATQARLYLPSGFTGLSSLSANTGISTNVFYTPSTTATYSVIAQPNQNYVNFSFSSNGSMTPTNGSAIFNDGVRVAGWFEVPVNELDMSSLPVLVDVSNERENEYTAIIDTSGNIEFQSPTFLTSANGTTGTGRRTLVWPDGFFGSNANAISVSATILDNDGSVSSITASNITTSGCRIFTEVANAAAFRRFSVTVKALGAAYKAQKAFIANAVSITNHVTGQEKETAETIDGEKIYSVVVGHVGNISTTTIIGNIGAGLKIPDWHNDNGTYLKILYTPSPTTGTDTRIMLRYYSSTGNVDIYASGVIAYPNKYIIRYTK